MTQLDPWATQVVQGPPARTVEDVALLLSVMAGSDPRCPISIGEDPAVFAAPLAADPRTLRVAWSPELGGAVPVEPAVAAVVAESARVFTELGCAVERDCPDFTGADEVFRILCGRHAGHREHCRICSETARTAAEACEVLLTALKR
ncbi:amidase family protein [Streptomyces sp. NPDC001732]